MCSSPRPKRTMRAAKKQFSGSVLANISTKSRANFAKRANSADERRQKIKRIQKENQGVQQKQSLLSPSKQATKQTLNTEKDWRYWFTQASFKEFMFALFFNKQIPNARN